jgi:hypothetical protein
MSTQSLPAPSLRTGHGLPAVRWVSRVVNYLIYQALWLILPAISGSKPSFLPALREGPGASALYSGERGAPPNARRFLSAILLLVVYALSGDRGRRQAGCVRPAVWRFPNSHPPAHRRRWRLDAVNQARILMDGFLDDPVAGKVRSRRCCTGSPQSHLL